MSTETLPQALAAGVMAQFGAGTRFMILTAAAAVNVVAVQLGAANKRIVLNGCQQGFTYDGTSDGGFDLLQITSATAQPGFVIVVGDDAVSYPNAVNVTGGTVDNEEVPAAAVTDQPAIVGIAGQKALFPANAARRRITVFSDPANANNAVAYVRAAGKTNNLGFLTPGESLEFKNTAAVDIQTAVAGDTFYLLEET